MLPSFSARSLLLLLGVSLLVAAPVLASSGDRNPTFQHCLKGCGITYCDPSVPDTNPWYLRAGGWDCTDNCKYSCMHSFTDNIRSGSRWHQFYGKWPFYRLGPLQEPLSVIFSVGNFWVHYKGLQEVRRRVRRENHMRRWLEVVAVVQMNTWIWSTVFHARDTPLSERLDYFSATLTIGVSLLYTVLRVPSLITPTSTSRLALPVIGGVALLVISHFSYLVSFPLGSFPYGYHIAFNVALAAVHSLFWILWSASFYVTLPDINIGKYSLSLKPYPPQDPTRVKSSNASTPLALVLLTTIAMSFELLDFAPLFRLLDAHALWHLATIPLAAGWWRFLTTDAIDLESAQMSRGEGGPMPLSGGASLASMGTPRSPKTPSMSSGVFQGITSRGTPKSPSMSGGAFQAIASASYPVKGGQGSGSPRSRSPVASGKGGLQA